MPDQGNGGGGPTGVVNPENRQQRQRRKAMKLVLKQRSQAFNLAWAGTIVVGLTSAWVAHAMFAPMFRAEVQVALAFLVAAFLLPNIVMALKTIGTDLSFRAQEESKAPQAVTTATAYSPSYGLPYKDVDKARKAAAGWSLLFSLIAVVAAIVLAGLYASYQLPFFKAFAFVVMMTSADAALKSVVFVLTKPSNDQTERVAWDEGDPRLKGQGPAGRQGSGSAAA